MSDGEVEVSLPISEPCGGRGAAEFVLRFHEESQRKNPNFNRFYSTGKKGYTNIVVQENGKTTSL